MRTAVESRRLRSALLAGLLLLAPASRAVEPALIGDKTHGGQLWRLECAGCHGDGHGFAEPTAIGRSLGAHRLRDPELLEARSDDDLVAVILKGGPGAGSPAFSHYNALDAGDLIAWLRAGLPSLQEVFPDAAAFTDKRYTLSGPALTRAETLAGGELSADERELAVFMVYGNERPPMGARLVGQDPVSLDALSPKDRKGFVVFGALKDAHGDLQPLAMGLANDYSVLKLVPAPGLDLSKVAPAVVGKGGREPGKRKEFISKTAPAQAAALTRLYARAVEAIAIASKEESDRHLFDQPDSSAKSGAH
jgi:mono/diheme cytochrome c family protein